MRVAVFTMLVLSFVEFAQAADSDRQRKLLVLLAGEVEFVVDSPDQAAILHAVERLADSGGGLEEALYRHIPWWTKGYPGDKRWVSELTLACERPGSFPDNLDWSGAYQHRCFQTVRKIRLFVAGKLDDPCKGSPNQWRARGKASRKARRIYYQVGCGRGSRHNWFDSRRFPDGRFRKK